MLNKILYSWCTLNGVCALLSASICNPYYPSEEPPSSNYVTVTFANASQNSGITASDIYITVLGSTSVANALRDFILFDLGSGVGSLSAAAQVLPSPYFYSLDSLPQDGNGNPYVFVPTNLEQAAICVGIDYGVAVQTLTGGTAGYWLINLPALTNTDANIYHLYDIVKFSTSPKLQFLGTQEQTSFGLPLSTLVTYNGGNTTYYLGLPLTTPRDDGTTGSMFGLYNSTVASISNANAQEQWGHGVRSFVPAGNAGATAYLQLLDPIFMMANSLFNPDYLFNATYGSDWFDAIFGPAGYYQNGVTDLYLDISALGAAFTTCHYVNNSPLGTLNFTSDGAGGNVTVAPIVSQPFFSSNPTNTNSFNATGIPAVYSAVCQYLSDGFVTGIFPTTFTAGAPLNSTYIQKAYVKSPTTFWGGSNQSPHPAGGPWYNLYAGTWHDLAPFSTTNNYSNVNPETGDVSMGFFQNIPPLSASTTATVAVVLGNMTGSVLPNFTDPTLYYILIAPSPGVTAIFGLTAVGSVATEFHNITTPVDLIIEYGDPSSYAGLTYGTQVFFNGIGPTANYMFAYPQVPAPIVPSLLMNGNTGTTVLTGETGWLIGVGRPN